MDGGPSPLPDLMAALNTYIIHVRRRRPAEAA
jgi:hypothetical protein